VAQVTQPPPPRFSSLSSRFEYLNFPQARFEYPNEQRGESQNMTIRGKVCDPHSASEMETKKKIVFFWCIRSEAAVYQNNTSSK